MRRQSVHLDSAFCHHPGGFRHILINLPCALFYSSNMGLNLFRSLHLHLHSLSRLNALHGNLIHGTADMIHRFPQSAQFFRCLTNAGNHIPGSLKNFFRHYPGSIRLGRNLLKLLPVYLFHRHTHQRHKHPCQQHTHYPDFHIRHFFRCISNGGKMIPHIYHIPRKSPHRNHDTAFDIHK